jgi:hypothetical protein
MAQASFRDAMRSEFSASREEIRAGDNETRRVLTERMESLFDENERHMRLLHEDLVEANSTNGRRTLNVDFASLSFTQRP